MKTDIKSLMGKALGAPKKSEPTTQEVVHPDPAVETPKKTQSVQRKGGGVITPKPTSVSFQKNDLAHAMKLEAYLMGHGVKISRTQLLKMGLHALQANPVLLDMARNYLQTAPDGRRK